MAAGSGIKRRMSSVGILKSISFTPDNVKILKKHPTQTPPLQLPRMSFFSSSNKHTTANKVVLSSKIGSAGEGNNSFDALEYLTGSLGSAGSSSGPTFYAQQ
ncbi:hypothetical protein DL89DRAFT_87474 [Linderina pennispora]|uniref:Uncharacterized protein n=1 Tax=Linderina pennispora TaxID=61395 RepID=A0A1Y1WIY0_9FUNG|nr:uncharacterized protein DL89DRAFT_87474 [Linderina pennispora]ORX73054.1 hypothetical protein DL89DRAFT_87474 [Linderina pennispora]